MQANTEKKVERAVVTPTVTTLYAMGNGTGVDVLRLPVAGHYGRPPCAADEVALAVTGNTSEGANFGGATFQMSGAAHPSVNSLSR